jgi:hypothetical protein
MTKTKKALKPRGLQGLLDSVFYRVRPLTPGASNNNHDIDRADMSRGGESRVFRSGGHGRAVV